MPYRLLRRNDTYGRRDPVWCIVAPHQRHDLTDPHTYGFRVHAEHDRDQMTRLYPLCDYVIVGSSNAYRWADLFARYTSSDAPTPVVEDDEDEDEDEDEVPTCGDCGEEGHDSWQHNSHYCERCDWSCEVHECTECVSWGPDSDWCEGCAEDHYADEDGRTGSPGLALRECSTCHSHDVHHDDIAEVFVCDCQARRLLADRRPVTLARPLPTLTEVA